VQAVRMGPAGTEYDMPAQRSRPHRVTTAAVGRALPPSQRRRAARPSRAHDLCVARSLHPLGRVPCHHRNEHWRALRAPAGGGRPSFASPRPTPAAARSSCSLLRSLPNPSEARGPMPPPPGPGQIGGAGASDLSRRGLCNHHRHHRRRTAAPGDTGVCVAPYVAVVSLLACGTHGDTGVCVAACIAVVSLLVCGTHGETGACGRSLCRRRRRAHRCAPCAATGAAWARGGCAAPRWAGPCTRTCTPRRRAAHGRRRVPTTTRPKASSSGAIGGPMTMARSAPEPPQRVGGRAAAAA